MATQAQVFEAPALEKGWQRSNAPELFKFEKRGDQIIGHLSDITRVEIDSQDREGQKQTVTQYLFTRADGTQIKALETYDLKQKVNRRMIGCVLKITYLGEDEKIKRGNNRMKVFDVQYRGTLRSESTSNSAPIGDEDIPF